jgi:hypothetical protein
VRRLGYRYLWIDSLCIIQDDDQDWRMQASRMADIYQGCLLTIAAAAAANSAQGLFNCLSPGPRGVLLSILTEQEDDSNIWIHQQLGHEREPLGTRGWVLQERTLSPRTLYFGKDELTWECLGATACQCGLIPDNFNSLKSKVNLDRRMDAAYGWYSVLREYVNLQLSHEEDIFPAISGISKQFQTLLGPQYIAGLWRDSIVNDLCWQVGTIAGHESVQAQRPTKWRAPSFSWANVVLSRGSYIQYPPNLLVSYHPCVKLIDTYCVPVGTDDTGQLSDAYIDLEGILVAATIRNLAGNCRWVLESDIRSFQPQGFFPDYGYEIDGPHRIVDGDEVLCLPVLQEFMDAPYWRRYWLVLRETKRRQDVRDGDTTEDIPVYERIGFLEEKGDPHNEDDIKYPRCLDPDGSKVVVRIT